MKIHLIAAARPNFMKIAPLYHALKKEDWAVPIIVHTGQHYDLNMSDAFFQDLNLPEPDIHLGVGSGTHAEQTGHVMIAYERVLMEQRPDVVIVVGDVNSTIACALAASKISYKPINTINSSDTTNLYPVKFFEKDSGAHLTGATNRRRPLVAHLEAGLRSFDRTMPEEINRLVTDSLADILWTPSPDADENLIREGISQDKIHRVGNIMIDSLEMLRGKIQKQNVYKEFDLKCGDYGLVTLHRPSNVDDKEDLETICRTLARIAHKIPLIFPVHPRTRKNLQKEGLISLIDDSPNFYITEPLNYLTFMNLLFNCRLAITDSGGIQEETTYLGIPCLTMRPNTERPITVSKGTNRLCTKDNLEDYIDSIISGKNLKYTVPELWDGHTAERVVKSIKSYMR